MPGLGLGLTPVAVHKTALVPVHWQEKCMLTWREMFALAVSTPTTWCSMMVVTGKAGGTPRRTVDLQPQNRCSVRQTHHVPSPFHLADHVPQGTKKTVTDAWNRYHSVAIREEYRHFTTCITPWGRYRYKVTPQGFLASGDAYTQRFDDIIADFQNKVKCVDEICMWANSSSKFQACTWFDICVRNSITLNPKKFQFVQDVDFAGPTITSTNKRPSAKFLDATRNFPTPTDITVARAMFGLINQGTLTFALTQQMKPFRALLKPSTPFIWTDELDKVFHQSKEITIEKMKDGVRLFDLDRPTCLPTDWSVDGIGFCMMQKYCQCVLKTPACYNDGWKLCLVGSRFTHPTESRKNLGPNAASRHPNGQPSRLPLPGEPPELLIDHLNTMVSRQDNLASLKSVSTVVTWDMVREATASNATLLNLIHHLETGFPDDIRELSAALRPFLRYAASLFVVDDVVLLGQRIIIPPVLRTSILNAFHAVHQSVSAMRARAMDSVYWPDITVDIARVRDQFATSIRYYTPRLPFPNNLQ
ncbi:uncharacterized protein LOC125668944 [Ostrea edulis]|uniref:uncharacterized protein LOC125668944 n=1 Tax=Ostrea edulis TaxID=37623 RepID=UPI0024AEB01D|nr:uncharacterized protein LOC125668944 [Ostrea edulis]